MAMADYTNGGNPSPTDCLADGFEITFDGIWAVSLSPSSSLYNMKIQKARKRNFKLHYIMKIQKMGIFRVPTIWFEYYTRLAHLNLVFWPF